MSLLTSFITVASTTSDLAGLTVLSRQQETIASSTSLTNSTSISNLDSSSTSFPFSYTKAATPHPSITSIIFPVVIGIICLLCLAGMCFFVHRKRQQGKQGWWGKNEEDYINYEPPTAYELDTRRIGQGVHEIENLGGSVAKNNNVRVVITREVEVADGENFEGSLAAARKKDTNDDVRRGAVWAASGGEEDGERTAMLAPKSGENTHEAVAVGNISEAGQGKATERLGREELVELAGAFAPTQKT